MTIKVHGAAYPGIWVEKQVTFVTVKFAADVGAEASYSGYGVVESCIVQAVKFLENRATVLGLSVYSSDSMSFQAMLGYAEGWFSDADGIIAVNVPVTGATVDNTLYPPAAIAPMTTTFDVSFADWNGTMPTATAAAGSLILGPGSTSGAYPAGSATGTPGYYPIDLSSGNR